MRPALADDLGDLVLAVVELLGERLIAARLFERIEIGALHVLDDGKLERLAIADFEQQHRHIVQARALRRAPASLAGDDLVLIHRAAHRAHQDRLDDAALADRCRELVKLGVRKRAPRIARVRLHELDRHAALVALTLQHLRFVADVADQCRQSTAEPRSICHHRFAPSLTPRAARVRAG